MDQSYFQNAPNLFRTLYKSGMDNILDRTGQKFGISVTGIMGVNCSSYMEIYERNNSFTTILTLTMFRILNMVDEKGKEILKNIVVNPTLDREHIKNFGIGSYRFNVLHEIVHFEYHKYYLTLKRQLAGFYYIVIDKFPRVIYCILLTSIIS